jgi:hypothetical protein
MKQWRSYSATNEEADLPPDLMLSLASSIAFQSTASHKGPPLAQKAGSDSDFKGVGIVGNVPFPDGIPVPLRA